MYELFRNVADYIDTCLDSITKQNYRDLEIILIDDGSQDDSLEICNKWADLDARIKVIHQKNTGVSSARNVGIEYATGEFITFVDPDDNVEISMYSEVIEYCKKYDIVGFGYNIIDYNKNVKAITKYTSFENAFTHEEIAERNYPRIMGLNVSDITRWNKGEHISKNRAKGMVWQYIFRTGLVKDNLIRFRNDLKLKEDEIFVMDALIYADSIVILSKPYYNYVQRTSSVSYTISDSDRLENKFALLRAKNDIRNTVLEKENRDILWTYAASNVLSILEVAIVCVNIRNGYLIYKEYIQTENIEESIEMLPLQFKNLKFNILLFFMKLKMYNCVYWLIKIALKIGINAIPKNIL